MKNSLKLNSKEVLQIVKDHLERRGYGKVVKVAPDITEILRGPDFSESIFTGLSVQFEDFEED